MLLLEILLNDDRVYISIPSELSPTVLTMVFKLTKLWLEVSPTIFKVKLPEVVILLEIINSLLDVVKYKAINTLVLFPEVMVLELTLV